MEAPRVEVAAAAAPAGPKVHKVHKTNRSRLTSAIRMIAKDTISYRGAAPLSAAGVAVIEDICKYVVKSAMEDCQRMMERRSTVTWKMVQSAMRMRIRNVNIFNAINNEGEKWSIKWSTAAAGELVPGAPKAKMGKLGHISPNRVRTMMRKAVPGCKRLAHSAAIYLAGCLNAIVVSFIKETNNSSQSVVAPSRLGVNDFYLATKNFIDLAAIIPYTMIVRCGGEVKHMARKSHKRSRSASPSPASPSPKKARKAPKKKKAAKKKSVWKAVGPKKSKK